ncbi:hypothetical protein RIF29_19267 [Crotalaria pallida]|uniref:Uncharacterized protein n=1 Tax=Crotalaria pallida TaxID=3830 RepID=A0AAN9I400_CROPI
MSEHGCSIVVSLLEKIPALMKMLLYSDGNSLDWREICSVLCAMQRCPSSSVSTVINVTNVLMDLITTAGCVGRKNYITFTCLTTVTLVWLIVVCGAGIAVFVQCFSDKRGTENQIAEKLGVGFPRVAFASIVDIRTYGYILAMITPSASPESSVNGDEDEQRSSLVLNIQQENIPDLEQGLITSSTNDPDAIQKPEPADKGKKLNKRHRVGLSLWKLAKLGSDEAAKATAKARASSSVFRPIGSRPHHYDIDHLSGSNVSGRNSPISSNQGFHNKNDAAGM